MKVLDRLFHLSDHHTTVRQELLEALTSFFSVAYILFVTPSYLSLTGMDYTGVLLATCLSSALACFLSAALNLPFALVPGLGFPTMFTYTLCQGYGCSWQQGLALVLLSGVLFLVLSLSPLRQRLNDALPMPFKFALFAGLGLLLTLSGPSTRVLSPRMRT